MLRHPSQTERNWRLENRLESLQMELMDLDHRITEDELPPGPTRSPLRSRRKTILARIADLKNLLDR